MFPKIKISVLYMFLKSHYHKILNTVKNKGMKEKRHLLQWKHAKQVILAIKSVS